MFVGPDSTVFTIARSRSTTVAAEHFGIDLDAGALAQGRGLLLSSDFFTVYQSLARIGGIDPLYCWAHIRRYFLRAGDAHPDLSGWTAAWTQRISGLYAAHRGYGAAQPGSAQASRAQTQISEAFAAMDSVRHAEAADPGTPAPARKVLATLDREWDGLVRHREYPELPLDNNTAEVRHEVARYAWTRRKEGRLMMMSMTRCRGPSCGRWRPGPTPAAPPPPPDAPIFVSMPATRREKSERTKIGAGVGAPGWGRRAGGAGQGAAGTG